MNEKSRISPSLISTGSETQEIHHHQCSAQGQVFDCKLRHQGCSSAQRQVFHCKLRNQGCSLPGINRCGSFPSQEIMGSFFSKYSTNILEQSKFVDLLYTNTHTDTRTHTQTHTRRHQHHQGLNSLEYWSISSIVFQIFFDFQDYILEPFRHSTSLIDHQL